MWQYYNSVYVHIDAVLIYNKHNIPVEMLHFSFEEHSADPLCTDFHLDLMLQCFQEVCLLLQGDSVHYSSQ